MYIVLQDYYINVRSVYWVRCVEMQLTLLDENVSTTMNVFLVMANILNLVYNIPQMVQTYKTKSTRDFSAAFLSLRVVGNVIWVVYAVEIGSVMFLINNVVTVVASLFIGYYKVVEMYTDYKTKPPDMLGGEQTMGDLETKESQLFLNDDST